MIQATLINVHPNEYRHEFHYYPFSVELDRCVRNFNILNDLSNKACVPNKTEDLNLSIFSMITGINESKILAKHISCKCCITYIAQNFYILLKFLLITIALLVAVSISCYLITY